MTTIRWTRTLEDSYLGLVRLLMRHALWLGPLFLMLYYLRIELYEIRALLLVGIFEFFALGVSGLAAFCYTRIDFEKEKSGTALGLIFLGVHIGIGLLVLGIYMSQY